MIAEIKVYKHTFKINLHNPIDISIPLKNGADNPLAWYIESPKFEPVKAEGFIGSVEEGGSVNFRNLYINPHAHGTHTECVGHISREHISINQCLKHFFFTAELVSVIPENMPNGDRVITRNILAEKMKRQATALIVRTLPNTSEKKSCNYAHTNPPYFSKEAIAFMLEMGVEHLLTDLPSVDKEKDGGALEAHHVFWNYPQEPALVRSITELIYVPDIVSDGFYLLNLMIAPLENDASPSKPILYEVLF